MNRNAVEIALEHGAMSLTGFIRKASNLLGLGGDVGGRLRPPPLDGEIIYCKNNVCVHPPANLNKSSSDHYPGYLNIRSQDDEILGSTLILTWIPNSTLKKNPRSIENSPATNRITPRRSPRQDYSRADYPTPSVESPASLDVVSGDAEAHACAPKNSCSYTPNNTSDRLSDTTTTEIINNERQALHSDVKTKIGTNVNPIYEKQVNVESNSLAQVRNNILCGADIESVPSLVSSADPKSSASSSSGLSRPSSKTTLRQLRENELRRSGSSNRSVASVEMDGDNLVVVTEEVFEEEPGKEPSTSEVNENNDEILPLASPNENLRQTLEKLAAAASKTVSNVCQANPQKLRESLDLRLNLNMDGDQLDEKVSDFDFEIPISSRPPPVGRKSSSSSTSGPDSAPPSPIMPAGSESFGNSLAWSPTDTLADGGYDSSSDIRHCMSFPENSVDFQSSSGTSTNPTPSKSGAEQVCGVFSVDLGQMRSLRIFYSDDACTSGQLVIASRESQYKILHFHHGGLDRLVETFSDWKFLAQPKRKAGDSDTHCRHFSVIRPYLTSSQCHPEEGVYEAVSDDTWRRHMNERGQIEDDFHLRKAIFFAGLHPTLRHEVWPFLLHYFPYSSTFEEREHLRNDRFIDYQNIRKARESMTTEEQEVFWRTVQCTVEKDVVRTDRCHPYFAGEGNPNIEILKNILLNYAVAHPGNGYSQGMSDLLAPVLAEVQNEVDAYWCFVGLMQKTTFFSSPTDIDMDSQLLYLRELLRILLPHFHRHIEKLSNGLELLFCHRWLLLCFKREFPEADALRLWEVCWSRYQTEYFHLFVCVAVIAVYGEDVVEQDLPADEMLLHFSSLSMHMSGDVVLRKSRGLLHQFRTLRCIPCTLDGLCTQSGPGMWDSGHVPAIECVGGHPSGECNAFVNSRTKLLSS